MFLLKQCKEEPTNQPKPAKNGCISFLQRWKVFQFLTWSHGKSRNQNHEMTHH